MQPIRMLARPLAAAPFVTTGLDAIRNPASRASQVAPAVKYVSERVTWVPEDPERLVRVQGGVSVGAGLLLAAGRLQRMATLMLAVTAAPTALTEHRYWTEDDPRRRNDERAHLVKNIGLTGALLLAATEPRRRSGTGRRATKGSAKGEPAKGRGNGSHKRTHGAGRGNARAARTAARKARRQR